MRAHSPEAGRHPVAKRNRGLLLTTEGERVKRYFLVPVLAAMWLAASSTLTFGQSAPRGTPYKIGFTAPLTGPLASISNEYVPALELAIADVNRRGGVKGHPLQLVVEDTLGSPQGGVAALRKLAQVDGVQAIVTIYTNVATAQIPLADQLKVPILAPVEGVGIMSAGQYSFAHAVTYPDIAPFFRDYWRKVKAKRVFAFLGNNGYGQSVAPVVRDTARSAGAEYEQVLVDLGSTDFRGVALRAKEFNPDQILVSIQGSSLETSVIRQLRELDVNTQLIEPGTFYQSKTWREGAGPYAEGMIFGGLFVNPAVSGDFVRAYRAKVGSDPVYGAAEFYDMVMMYADAFGKVGYNGEALRGALASMSGVPSIFGGTISMQSNHYTKISAVGIWQVRAGKLVPLKI
jgi:branched-chain amino acid transport system substrate-binding protein